MALPPPVNGKKRTIDPVKVRLSILGMVVFALFIGLFSRLWYLQVLDSAEFAAIAKENQVRRVESEPPRGRILTRSGGVIVDNKLSLAVSLQRDLIDQPGKRKQVLDRLSLALDIPSGELRKEVRDATVSPYKPVAVATDVPKKKVFYIEEHPERFPGVVIERIPVRRVLQGYLAPHVIGYTSEISAPELKLPEWKGYKPGDIIGKAGVEATFDRYLRGIPRLERMIVDSAGDVVKGPKVIQEEEPGADVVTTIAPGIQRAAQSALTSGLLAARPEYPAVTGGAVVMDPRDGDVLAMATYPTYDASILADGMSLKDQKKLGVNSKEDNTDDQLISHAYQAPLPPGSTYKVVTAAAAMNLGIYEPSTYLNCPFEYVPGDSFTEFYNWTSTDLGSMNLVEAIEQSCNTFFYQLGWSMESRWGSIGDGTFAFQRFVRRMGFGHETGLGLANESDGRVPDRAMCDLPTFCPEGRYLPGYTVNMAVGQGDLLVTPMQMAVATAAIANGGNVLQPRIVKELRTTDESSGDEVILEEFEPQVRNRIELTETEWEAIRTGMELVVASPAGTANSAFAGFPNPAFPIAGKTGSAQTGESDAPPHSWFISYAPADDPKYVIAVQVELGGHGGETAAPIAREIYEAIFQNDQSTGDVNSGSDTSD